MFTLLIASVLAGASLTAPACAHLVVAADGSASFATVQAAIDAVPAGGTVSLKPGTYREVITVPASKIGITLRGTTGKSSDVVIDYDNAGGTKKPDGSTYGTTGSATATIAANGFTASALTFRNSFDRRAHPEITATQAVAAKTTGDRMVFDNVTFLGHQDTLYADTAAVGTAGRQYYRNCAISGDVDFLFGRATAVFDRATITALDRGSNPNGYLTAASTRRTTPYGFLIVGSKVISPAASASFYLGRPWHPGGDVDAIAQVVRFFEYRNTGPGAGTGTDRPQLTDAQAATFTAQRYLAGSDGWNPVH
jgi:pectinesterase/pectate lyase